MTLQNYATNKQHPQADESNMHVAILSIGVSLVVALISLTLLAFS